MNKYKKMKFGNTPDNIGTNSMVTAVLLTTPDETPYAASAVTTETDQHVMLATAGDGGRAPRTLHAPGVASLVSLFAILALINSKKNEPPHSRAVGYLNV